MRRISSRGGADGTWLVALGAALWGTDALLRAPLAGALPAASIVFWEHLIIVVVLVGVAAAGVAGPRRDVGPVAPGDDGQTLLGLRERSRRPVVHADPAPARS